MSDSEFTLRLRARAAALAVRVTDSEAREFETFYGLLAKWNRRINLTALKLDAVPPEETLDRLFIEPLIASELIPTTPIALVDLGSGAGSPALPLKILRPHIRLMMVETRGRKAAFLREAVRTLRLDDVDVEQMRFQSLSASMVSEFDVVVVRALRIDGELLSSVVELLNTGGRFITFGLDQAPPGFTPAERRRLPDQSETVSWVLT